MNPAGQRPAKRRERISRGGRRIRGFTERVSVTMLRNGVFPLPGRELTPALNSFRQKGTGKMKKYECTVCGYIYDPQEGDKDGGIPPGTAFEKLPEDWVCPVCGAAKSEFEPVG